MPGPTRTASRSKKLSRKESAVSIFTPNRSAKKKRAASSGQTSPSLCATGTIPGTRRQAGFDVPFLKGEIIMNSKDAIKNLSTRVSSTLIVMTALASGTFAQTALHADAHTSFTSANQNYGTNPALSVSATNTAYVRFEIARTLPAGTKGDDVAKATVQFYLSKVTNAGKLDLYPILGDWDEKTISANNAPPLGPLAVTTQQINKDAQGNYVV